MITQKDLVDYFNVETDAASEKAKELREMEIEAKVAARKAIIGLRLDAEFKDSNEDGQVRLLHVEENLSEFKNGEAVVLCVQPEGAIVCECNVYQFRDDGDVEIVINSYNYNSSIDERTGDTLMLIKQEVSMVNFYRNFACRSEFLKEKYFEEHIINNHTSPSIRPYTCVDEKKNISCVSDYWNIQLNDKQNEAMMKTEYANDYYLIQGPPGTGKSCLTAIRLFDEIMNGHKVVLTGPTHMAINNALVKTAELMDKCFKGDAVNVIHNTIFKCGQSYNANGLSFTDLGGDTVTIENIQYLNVDAFNCWQDKDENKLPYGWVVGMTPYSLQGRRAAGLKFDTLFIDEAGQLTIPIAMMAMVDKHKVILAGDHKQLPPIFSEKQENEELKHSIFEHLIRKDNSTMLNVSFRMNDDICRMVSDLFYDGLLKPFDGSKRLKCSLSDPLYSGEHSIVMVDCPCQGRQTSIAETQRAIDIICAYIESGIHPRDIAVLAPFRAQCAMLRKKLVSEKRITEEQRLDIIIDTVDRMQGQEREIIIYSFTAGDSDYMHELADFLYNPNKLNVAFSRAKNKLILLGNVSALRVAPSELMKQVLDRKEVYYY